VFHLERVSNPNDVSDPDTVLCLVRDQDGSYIDMQTINKFFDLVHDDETVATVCDLINLLHSLHNDRLVGLEA